MSVAANPRYVSNLTPIQIAKPRLPNQLRFGLMIIQANYWSKPDGHTVVIPRCIISVAENTSIIPILNHGSREVNLKPWQTIARGWPCKQEPYPAPSATISRLSKEELSELTLDDMKVGDVPVEAKNHLVKLLNEYRDKFNLKKKHPNNPHRSFVQ